jgi:hypothetical protein
MSLPFYGLLQTVIFLLFDFHGLAAANDCTRAGFGNDHFCTAFCTAVSLTYDICHNRHLLFANLSCLIIGLKRKSCQNKTARLCVKSLIVVLVGEGKRGKEAW